MKKIFGAALIVVIAIGALNIVPALAHGHQEVKVTLCHATSSNTNPYVKVTVSGNSVENKDNWLNGHGGHSNDIWPSFHLADGTFVAAQGDQSILNNDCKLPKPPTQTPTNPPTETNTPPTETNTPPTETVTPPTETNTPPTETNTPPTPVVTPTPGHGRSPCEYAAWQYANGADPSNPGPVLQKAEQKCAASGGTNWVSQFVNSIVNWFTNLFR